MHTLPNLKIFSITSLISSKIKRSLHLCSTGIVSAGTNCALYESTITNNQLWVYSNSRLHSYLDISYCLNRYNLPTNCNYNNADVDKVMQNMNINQEIDIIRTEYYFQIKLASNKLYLTAKSDENGTADGKTTNSNGNVFWDIYRNNNCQRWLFEEYII